MRRARLAGLPLLFLPWSGPALAQMPAGCHGLSEIERALATQPTAEAFNALGAWFAQHDRDKCAIAAFRSAIRLQPNSWDGHFNLALVLMDEHHFKDAITELRQTDKLSPGHA